TEEDALNEMVQLVGMDALSAPDRLKMEAARSIREDYLHQNAFHDVDTYSSLKKQHLLMQLILAYYDEGREALERGADVNRLAALPVREQIGRYKYTTEDRLDQEYEAVLAQLRQEMSEAV
ncbi:MAG: V-type ATP synthase subunit A, partial [Lachnospiraceae bacterium]